MADTQTTIRRVESFPFDSSADGYDADGYPVYDRAVGASVLRAVFKQFFTDGVFGTPADALQIAKGEGLSVTIQPGVFIIQGAMGGVYGDASTVALDSEPPQGNVAYGIMLRYDENENEVGGTNVGRSLSIRVVKGEAASKPTPPSPDKSTPGVMEYRLGYVVVPSGAADLTGATVTNEKGLESCPYAAPFEEIDVSEILNDVRLRGDEQFEAFVKFLNENYDFLNSAIDGTVAGNLQSQIDNLKEQTLNAGSLDPRYLALQDTDVPREQKIGIVAGAITDREIAADAVTAEKVAADAVTTDKVADKNITAAKLSEDLQNRIGVLDTSDWDAEKYLAFTKGLETDEAKNTFVTEYVTKSVFNKWEIDKQIAYLNAIPTESQTRLGGFFDYTGTSWENLKKYGNEAPIAAVKPAVGKIRNVTITGYGSVPCAIVGVRADNKVSGGKAAFTFDCKKLLFKDKLNDGYVNDGYDTWTIYAKLNNEVFGKIESGVKSLIEDVVKDKIYCTGYSGNAVKGTFNAKVWVMSKGELFGAKEATLQDGARYELFSSGGAEARKKTMIGGTTSFDNYYWTRTPFESNHGWDSCNEVNDTGSMVSSSSNYMDEPSGIPIAFCI